MTLQLTNATLYLKIVNSYLKITTSYLTIVTSYLTNATLVLISNFSSQLLILFYLFFTMRQKTSFHKEYSTQSNRKALHSLVIANIWLINVSDLTAL